AYLKAMDNMPNASSYLVDFDGDGSDELLLWDNQSYENKRYEVWDGSRKIASAAMDFVMNDPPESAYYELARSTEAPEQMFFRYHLSFRQDHQIYYTYTIENGEWHRVEDAKWVESYQENMFTTDNHVNDRYFSGQSMADYEVFQQLVAEMNAKYSRTEMLQGNHSDRSKVVAALDTAADGYKDVLSSLSASERKALFESFLPPFSGYDADYRTISDQKLLQMINDAWYDHNIAFDAIDRLSWIDLPNFDRAITKSDADKLTTALFGRTLDFSKFKRSTLPDMEDSNNFCYVYQDMLCFHAYFGMGSFPGTIQFIPQHLYDLGSGYFAAGMMEEWCHDDGTLNSDLYYSVIKKNTDGTYRFIRTYPANYVPSDTELAAFAAPSDWAKAEVEAADSAGLIPELNGNPGWQDNTTRLQFAQLAVRLAETVTGQTLPAAPASTFADCTELDVRKAYAAGIVNGTSDTTFSPDSKLTREQLATMLWRAASYIQQQTGEQMLTAGGSLTGYTDANQVSAYAKEAVTSLAQHGIMKGTSATALSPQQNCSVEQSVLLSYRMMQQLT
ncbi:S-layer homology domain-containing protein, partial [uncultured Agathobaculum sp.]|uniref:S-layer homology domain-containing protein n=1 Tax=uncultured Agathobaculum sp. TaxID=2048140 RepID=UPI003209B243